MKQRYRFSHRGTDNRYYWESVESIGGGDARHEQISCPVDWFWTGENPIDALGKALMLQLLNQARKERL